MRARRSARLFSVTVYLRLGEPGSFSFPWRLSTSNLTAPVSVEGKFFTTSCCFGMFTGAVAAVVVGVDDPEPPQPATARTYAVTAATPIASLALDTTPG
jgi:hypothetical protein